MNPEPEIREKVAPPGRLCLVLSSWGKLLAFVSPDGQVLHMPLMLDTVPKPGESGGLEVVRGSHPIEYLESIRSIPAPPGATAIPLDTLDADDRAALEKAAAVGGVVAELLRRKKTGLVIAGAIPPGMRKP